MDTRIDKHQLGFFNKFNVSRADGKDAPGEKHHGDQYFVLSITSDPHSVPALAAYIESCRSEYPVLADDLQKLISNKILTSSEFITVPEVTLPSGRVVPSFRVAKYLSCRGPADFPVSTSTGKTWVNISYNKARDVVFRADLELLTETQALAIAFDISQQDTNWTGGKVGEGDLFQGLRKGTMNGACAGNIIPDDDDERRWHRLSNGETIFDFSGNAFTWIFDDVQGDENGLTTIIKADSISLTTAPHPSMEKGMGWRPDGQRDWSGNALIRGGCWGSESYAGAFYLINDWPDFGYDYVGFRCTQPSL